MTSQKLKAARLIRGTVCGLPNVRRTRSRYRAKSPPHPQSMLPALESMTLVPSLLQSIVLMDGEALVLHVGDRPYVVAESGQVTLANTGLTAAAITEVLDELLPADARRTLADVGATQCVL